MHHAPIRHFLLITALGLFFAGPSLHAAGPAMPAAPREAMAQAASPEAIADYQRRLGEYKEARAAFDAQAGAYWKAIADKRRGRNAKRRDHVPIALDDYVLEQPPVYTGPKRPANPQPEPEGEPREPKYIPVVADLLQAARDQFQWSPQRPTNESDFKRAYASFATAGGLTREQAVRVYAFETGGNGKHDSQSGFKGNRAISTAIGYNQLLTTNTVELLAEQGTLFIRVLGERVGQTSGPGRQAMEHKLAVLKKMVAIARSVPDDWSAHEQIGNSQQGWALHAMVLDIDVGPMLQTYKLLTSVLFARAKGFNKPLSAAELEMMNLTGDGTGFDMVTMPLEMRDQVPTANFFQRGGYERNPVAVRHNTVAKLLAVTDARMDSLSSLPGSKELAGAFN
jgi:hypothetical protein